MKDAKKKKCVYTLRYIPCYVSRRGGTRYVYYFRLGTPHKNITSYIHEYLCVYELWKYVYTYLCKNINAHT